MKISWGTGIVLALAAFISFILFLVISMTTNKELDHDLVVEEYYKKELEFQEQLDNERNAQQLMEDISVEKTEAGFLVHFPEDFEIEKIKGKMFLYRPSNKQLDFEIPVSLSTHTLLVPDKRLVGGRWNIEINWEYGQEAYFFQKELTY